MIEILLGAKGTGKTNFLQKENASVIRNTASYATADSLVNDWSKYKYINYFCGGANLERE